MHTDETKEDLLEKEETSADQLERIDTCIQYLFKIAKDVQTDFSKKSLNTKESIKYILMEAGLWDRIHKLETDLIETQKESESELVKIQNELNNLGDLKSFISEYAAKHTRIVVSQGKEPGTNIVLKEVV